MLALAKTTAAAEALPHEALLEVTGLTKNFAIRGSGLLGRKMWLRAVGGVSFAIASGETLGVVGESGCGKSTLGRLILRLLEPTSGTIRFDGRDISALPEPAMRPLRRQLQVVFQDPFSSLNPRLKVREIVAEPLENVGLRRREIRQRVAEVLELVGLGADVMDRYPHAFSGGQRQRIGIARALALGRGSWCATRRSRRSTSRSRRRSSTSCSTCSGSWASRSCSSRITSRWSAM